MSKYPLARTEHTVSTRYAHRYAGRVLFGGLHCSFRQELEEERFRMEEAADKKVHMVTAAIHKSVKRKRHEFEQEVKQSTVSLDLFNAIQVHSPPPYRYTAHPHTGIPPALYRYTTCSVQVHTLPPYRYTARPHTGTPPAPI